MDVAKVELYALGWFAPGREHVVAVLADLVATVPGVHSVEIWAGPPDQRVVKGRAGEEHPPAGLCRHTELIVTEDGARLGGVEATYDLDADRHEVARVAGHVVANLWARLNRWRERGRDRGLAVADAEGNLLWADEELGRIMGWSVEEALGTNVLSFLHPDDFVAAAEAFGRTARFPGPKAPFDLRFRAGDGSWILLETIAENQLDDPDVGGIVFSLRDPHHRTPADRLVSTETEVLTAIAADVPWTDVFDLVVEMLDDRLPPARWSVWAPPDTTVAGTAADPDHLVPAAGRGDGDRTVVPVAEDGPATGMAFDRRQTVVVTDVDQDDAVAATDAAAMRAAGARSLWAVPILDRDGTPAAVLEGRLHTVGRPSPDQSRVLDLATKLLALTIERDRTHRIRDHAASHDAMTGLANRHAFTGLLEASIATTPAGRLAVLMVDVDGLKTVNDSLGHQAGDTALHTVADRIRRCCDDSAAVVGLARFGGDEFTVLVDGPAVASVLADRILDRLAEPLPVDGHDLHIGAHIGIAVHDAVLSPTASDLLSNADAAMEVATRTRPRRTVTFDSSIASLVARRLAISSGLRRAIEAEEFVVHYQSIVDLRTAEPVAAEALVRWYEGDVVHPPGEFLEIAEDTGLIVPIGRLVLGHAARRTARRAQPTFVNLSAHQLLDQGLAGLIDAALAQAGVEPECIGFEITEHAVIPDPAAAIDVLEQLRAAGHPLSIDDFGTGYASLAYLRDLPVDSVKIDRSFTARMHDDPRTHTILAATIELAHDLDLTVVAEGIESERDAEAMAELGCDHGQGWFFHRPAPDA